MYNPGLIGRLYISFDLKTEEDSLTTTDLYINFFNEDDRDINLQADQP